MSLIGDKLTKLESQVNRLNNGEIEDVGVAYKDLEEVKKRVTEIERRLNLQSVV